MPFCRECGKPVEKDWKNCPFCGESLSTNSHDNQQKSTIVVHKQSKPDSVFIYFGIICLFVTAWSYAEFSNSICGTVLSPLASDCSSWEAFNLICGGMGIITILLGLRGKPTKK